MIFILVFGDFFRGFTIISSGNHFVQPISRTNFCNFDKGAYEEHICEIILKQETGPLA